MTVYHSFLIAALALVVSTGARAELRVFACEPEWAALVSELGGDRVDVYSATNAHQNAHYIQARPSLIAKARNADLLVCTGAELEIGWLPLVQRRAGNPAIQPGQPGYFEAADAVEMIGIPQRLDRAEGDVHPRGNPHIHLDPHNISRVAHALGERLAQLDPDSADQYRRATEDFLARWQQAIADWETRAAPLNGMQIVVFHAGWGYLNRWLGLKQVAVLEPKPGIAPNSRHLAAVLQKLENHDPDAIVRAHYQDARASEWLHERTGIPLLELPYTVGASDQAGDLFGLFDSTIDTLLQAQPD